MMDKMNLLSVNFRRELVEVIDPRFFCSPVVLLPPVNCEFTYFLDMLCTLNLCLVVGQWVPANRRSRSPRTEPGTCIVQSTRAETKPRRRQNSHAPRPIVHIHNTRHTGIVPPEPRRRQENNQVFTARTELQSAPRLPIQGRASAFGHIGPAPWSSA